MDHHSITILWTSIVLGLSILLSGFFSSSEMVYTTLDVSKFREYAHRKKKISFSSRVTINLLRNYSRTLNTILVGNNLVNIGGTTVSGILFTEIFGNAGLGIATGLMTLFILVFGEVWPKNIARKHPNTLSLYFSTPIWLLSWFFRPITIFFTIFSKAESPITSNEKQLSSLVRTMHEEGQLEQEEGELIQHAMEFDEKIVKEIVYPWTDVTFVKIGDSNDEVERTFITSGYSRLPVMSDDGLTPKGIITFKAFFTGKGKSNWHFSHDMKEPIIFSQYDHLSSVMDDLREERQHLGFVVMNKKSEKIIGILSLEDLIEEIVGEIYDENDEIEGAYEIGHSKWIVKGNMSINKFLTQYLGKKGGLEEQTITQFVAQILPDNIRLDVGIKVAWKNITFAVNEFLPSGIIEYEITVLQKKSKI